MVTMVIKVTMVTQILCDTVCVWGLYFRDSAFREHVLELRKSNLLLVPEICLVEAAYPIYRAKGLRELRNYSEFVEHLPLSRNIKLLPLTLENLAQALRLAAEHSSYFVDEEGNLNLYDAILAATWEEFRAPLATADSKLLSYGRALGLECVELRRTRK